MAIYHLNVKTGSRDGGQSARARAQYIVREGKDEKDRDELAHSESGNMPEWAQDDPRGYWAAADAHERVNGRLFVEVECALPKELNEAQQRTLAHSFAAELTGQVRLPYTMALRRGGGENPHVRLMISERALDGHDRDAARWFKRYNRKEPEKGGARKSLSIKGKEWLENTRRGWARAANRALEEAGRAERIDHRSLEAQRAEALERGELDRAAELDRIPGIHLGPERYRAERGGHSRVVRYGRGNRAEKPCRSSGTGRTQEPGRVRGSGGPGSGAADTGVGLRNQFGAAARCVGEDSNAAGGGVQGRRAMDSRASRAAAESAETDGAGVTGPGDRTVMDEEQLRAALRGLIAEEVHQQLSQYRGAVSAELKFMDKELETGLKAIKGKFNSLGNEIRESHAESVREGITQAQGIVGVWGRALLSGAFIFAGIGAAAWIGIAWTEQQFRWQVTKSAEIAEQIAATEDTLDRLNRGSGGLTLTDRDSDGRCFVLFPAVADVTTVWRVRNRPAIKVECDE